ncbi:MAG: fatty acid desaturase [Saprospiraceae bacterium]|jgi:fatty acid desaturase
MLTIFFCIQHFNPLSYGLAVIIIGARMHALAILMHDATHYRFLKNRKRNDLITNMMTMYPLFTSIEKYRQNHMEHHRHLNTEHDPDWVSKIGKRAFTFPKTKIEFIATLLSYFVLYQGIMDAVWFLKRFGTAKTKSNNNPGQKKHQLLFYTLLFVGLTIGGFWIEFILFWIIPFLSTFFMFQYIRSVAEHFGELAYDDLLSSTRSVKANLLERFFIAPHQVGYHLEHHLYPGVPFYNLPKLHQHLMTVSDYNSKAHITHGYLTGLLDELGHQRKVELVQ